MIHIFFLPHFSATLGYLHTTFQLKGAKTVLKLGCKIYLSNNYSKITIINLKYILKVDHLYENVLQSQHISFNIRLAPLTT